MLFNAIQLVALVSAVALPAAAVDMCFYSNTLGCSGSAVCCWGHPASTCCGPSTASTGFSVFWNGLPNFSSAQLWSNSGCSPASAGINTFLFGPGGKCWTGGGQRAVSAAWANTASRIASSAAVDVVDSGDVTTSCSAPNVFRYPDADGTLHNIQITPDHDADSLQALYDAGDFAALDALKSADN